MVVGGLTPSELSFDVVSARRILINKTVSHRPDGASTHLAPK